MKVIVAGIVTVFAFVLFLEGSNQAGEKPKYTISQVMKKAMKGGLCAKVASGKASEAEQKELVELFTALCANKPPMGDEKAWKERTSALLEAAKKNDGAALKKNATCKTCHDAYKG